MKIIPTTNSLRNQRSAARRALYDFVASEQDEAKIVPYPSDGMTPEELRDWFVEVLREENRTHDHFCAIRVHYSKRYDETYLYRL